MRSFLTLSGAFVLLLVAASEYGHSQTVSCQTTPSRCHESSKPCTPTTQGYSWEKPCSPALECSPAERCQCEQNVCRRCRFTALELCDDLHPVKLRLNYVDDDRRIELLDEKDNCLAYASDVPGKVSFSPACCQLTRLERTVVRTCDKDQALKSLVEQELEIQVELLEVYRIRPDEVALLVRADSGCVPQQYFVYINCDCSCYDGTLGGDGLGFGLLGLGYGQEGGYGYGSGFGPGRGYLPGLGYGSGLGSSSLPSSGQNFGSKSECQLPTQLFSEMCRDGKFPNGCGYPIRPGACPPPLSYSGCDYSSHCAPANVVPEPSSIISALIGLGSLGAGYLFKRRRQRTQDANPPG